MSSLLTRMKKMKKRKRPSTRPPKAPTKRTKTHKPKRRRPTTRPPNRVKRIVHHHQAKTVVSHIEPVNPVVVVSHVEPVVETVVEPVNPVVVEEPVHTRVPSSLITDNDSEEYSLADSDLSDLIDGDMFVLKPSQPSQTKTPTFNLQKKKGSVLLTLDHVRRLSIADRPMYTASIYMNELG